MGDASSLISAGERCETGPGADIGGGGKIGKDSGDGLCRRRDYGIGRTGGQADRRTGGQADRRTGGQDNNKITSFRAQRGTYSVQSSKLVEYVP